MMFATMPTPAAPGTFPIPDRPILVVDEKEAAGITGPLAIDGIGPVDDWKGYYQRSETDRRQAMSWKA